MYDFLLQEGGQKKSFLGLCPKLWVDGDQDSQTSGEVLDLRVYIPFWVILSHLFVKFLVRICFLYDCSEALGWVGEVCRFGQCPKTTFPFPSLRDDRNPKFGWIGRCECAILGFCTTPASVATSLYRFPPRPHLCNSSMLSSVHIFIFGDTRHCNTSRHSSEIAQIVGSILADCPVFCICLLTLNIWQ